MISLNIEKVYMPKDTQSLLSKFNLAKGGLAQKALDTAVMDYNLEYVPWEIGTLGRSPYAVTQIGSGKVVYPGPYAHYMYYGEVYGPNIPVFEDNSGEPTRWFSPPRRKKDPTGRALQYSKDMNPLAGSYWFERMKADHLQDIIQEVKDVIGVK